MLVKYPDGASISSTKYSFSPSPYDVIPPKSTIPFSSETAVAIVSSSLNVFNTFASFSVTSNSFVPYEVNLNLAPFNTSSVFESILLILILYWTLIFAFKTTVSKSS